MFYDQENALNMFLCWKINTGCVNQIVSFTVSQPIKKHRNVRNQILQEKMEICIQLSLVKPTYWK